MATTYTKILDAVTTTQTVPTVGVVVGDRARMSIQFIGTAITSGNGLFKVQVSNTGDPDDFISYNRLSDNLTKASTAADTWVGSSTVSANGSKIYFFPAGDHFNYLRVGVQVTTDGTYSAVLHTLTD